MNKWQKQINRFAKFRGHDKRFKHRNFRRCRIRLRHNIKKYDWSYEEFKNMTTNYINRRIKIFNEVEKELNIKLNYEEDHNHDY